MKKHFQLVGAILVAKTVSEGGLNSLKIYRPKTGAIDK